MWFKNVLEKLLVQILLRNASKMPQMPHTRQLIDLYSVFPELASVVVVDV